MWQELLILDWHPTPLNKLIGCHRGTRSKRKRADRDLVKIMTLQQRLSPAAGPRELFVELVFGPGQRKCDVDAYDKSLLDALKTAKLIVDDRDPHIVYGRPIFKRGARAATIVFLHDI